MLDLSIIIVNWNVSDYLDRCLRSIEENVRGVTYEVIVVDNASDDGSVAMVSEKHTDVAVIANRSNAGFCRGNNQGLEASQGENFILLNPDTEVRSGAMEAMVKFLREHPGVGVVGPKILSPDDLYMPNGSMFPSVWRELYRSFGFHHLIKQRYERDEFGRDDLDVEAEVDVVCGACLMGRRKVFEKIGGLDEKLFMYFDETDFCRRVKEAGWKVWYVPEARIFHHWMKSVRRDYIAAARRMSRSRYLYFKKHHGILAAMVLRLLNQPVVEFQCARIKAVQLRDRVLRRGAGA